MPKKNLYNRVMLKLSGEVLQGGGSKTVARQDVAVNGSIDRASLESFCSQIAAVHKKGIGVVIVPGGGNFWRYRDQKNLELPRVVSDNIGMLATVMNATALQACFAGMGVKSIAMSAVSMPRVIDDYTPRLALKALECGWIVIAAGGTGNPFFSTDSAAALRGLELSCDVLLKGTKVDYVYDRDPKKYKDARKFEKISFQEVLERGLEVMDFTAISLCKDGGLPIRVFNMEKKDSLEKVVTDALFGTIIS